MRIIWGGAPPERRVDGVGINAQTQFRPCEKQICSGVLPVQFRNPCTDVPERLRVDGGRGRFGDWCLHGRQTIWSGAAPCRNGVPVLHNQKGRSGESRFAITNQPIISISRDYMHQQSFQITITRRESRSHRNTVMLVWRPGSWQQI